MNNDLSQTSEKNMTNFAQNALFIYFKHTACCYIIITCYYYHHNNHRHYYYFYYRNVRSLFVLWKSVLVAVQKSCPRAG